jgi:hypothetical protein
MALPRPVPNPRRHGTTTPPRSISASRCRRFPYGAHPTAPTGLSAGRLTPGSLVPRSRAPSPRRGEREGLSVAYLSFDANRRRLCHLIGDAITLGRAARVREASGAAGEGEGG